MQIFRFGSASRRLCDVNKMYCKQQCDGKCSADARKVYVAYTHTHTLLARDFPVYPQWTLLLRLLTKPRERQLRNKVRPIWQQAHWRCWQVAALVAASPVGVQAHRNAAQSYLSAQLPRWLYQIRKRSRAPSGQSSGLAPRLARAITTAATQNAFLVYLYLGTLLSRRNGRTL